MYTVNITLPADEDLKKIARYIALDNPYRAISFTLELLKSVEKVLSQFPEAGKKYKNAYCLPYKKLFK